MGTGVKVYLYVRASLGLGTDGRFMMLAVASLPLGDASLSLRNYHLDQL